MIAVAIDQILRLAPSISAGHRAGGVEHEGDLDNGLRAIACGGISEAGKTSERKCQQLRSSEA